MYFNNAHYWLLIKFWIKTKQNKKQTKVIKDCSIIGNAIRS